MKLKRTDEAVSPVIATILMVAITVVLAAVLYVMVIGMGGGGTATPAPVGGWQDMSPNSRNSATMTFGTFSPEVAPIDIKLIIEDQNGHIFNLSWSTASITTNNYTLTSDDPTITAYYYDNNPSGGLIGGGDHITLYGLDSFTYYYVKVFHYESDSIIQMAGTTNFQTVP